MMSRILLTGTNQITQAYGGSHGGIDIVKKTNQLDNIAAHSDGTVTYVQTGHSNNQGSSGMDSYGNLVIIQHENGYYTYYAHLNSVAVAKGDSVKQGDKIGYMGNTGNSYGAHLHFEVRDSSKTRIDPTNYINADLPGATALTEIEIDGRWGQATTKALQTKLGSTVDGIISNQSTTSKYLHTECSGTSWEWNDNSSGSNCIKALQKLVDTSLDVDGKCGVLTIKALQNFLNTEITGYLDSSTVKALQNFINE